MNTAPLMVRSLLLLLSAGTMAGCTDSAVETGLRFPAEPVGRGGPAERCVVCHSVEEHGPFRSAPPLWGIVDADKARHDWYGYSPALARAAGDWSREDLDKYLTDPDGFLPGTTKTLIGIPDPEERDAIIDYLADLRATEPGR